MKIDACDDCLRRTDLVAALAGRLDVQWRRREGRRAAVLALSDEALLDLGGPPARARYAGFAAAGARARIEAAGLAAVCRCRPAYPPSLLALEDPPAVLHVAGAPPSVPAAGAVAVVGARRATPYALEVARGLGRGLGTAGVEVVSGMALGVDSAAHAGALEAGAPTIAVLAGGADLPYPASKRRLYEEIVRRGGVVAELPPGFGARRWCFPARNRIISALSGATIVVEAGERSGSLITADLAADLGRPVGAVPGRVTSPPAAGSNGLLHAGAHVVRGVEDVLDLLTGVGWARPPGVVVQAAAPPPPEPELRRLLDALARGAGSVAELATTADEARAAAAGLTELELRGLVRRGFGGRYVLPLTPP